jgi:hypothetical protein
MSVPDDLDQRIRARLTRSAQLVELDPATLLPAATERGRRSLRERRQVRRLGAGVAVAAIAAALFIAPRTFHETASPPAERLGDSQLIGGFGRDITGQAGAVQAGHHLAGSWSLQFTARGTVQVGAPSAFDGVRTGVSFADRGHLVRIDLFAQDLCAGSPVGTYRWSVRSDGLRFARASDTCPARISVLTGGLWHRTP